VPACFMIAFAVCRLSQLRGTVTTIVPSHHIS
jgi:hypothetical protein